MKFKPQWYRVAKEGKTIDGRVITKEQIEQMGSNYNAKEKHGARIWIEHFRSLLPEGIFPPQGDVLETKSEKGDDGKLGLFALIQPLPSLIEMTSKGNKIYSSIEMHPNYADTGEAYLTGLACTDNPSSAGTSVFSFNAENPEFKNKYFSEYLEQSDFKFDEDTPEEEKPKFFDKISKLFSTQKTNNDDRFSDHEQAMTLIAEKLDEQKTEFADLTKKVESISAGNGGDETQVTQEAFNTLKDNLEKAQKDIETFAAQEPGQRRKPASGDNKEKPRF